jgi:hypothetical protein
VSLVLNVEILGEFKKLTDATKGSEKSLSGLESQAKKFSKGINTALATIGIGVSVAALVSFGKEAIRGAEAAQVADKRLAQVTKSMNLFGEDTAEVTNRLVKFADKQELLTGVTAETVKQVQASLITFGNLGKTANELGGNFDRATKAALDLAAAGFGSAETNAIQLGKALQDPIKGLTALSRSGVTFTEQEKERIATLVESNRLGEAQAVILAAIEQQVGGTAEATVTASARMEAAFGQIQDAVGLALLPVLEEFSTWLATPEGQEKIQGIIDGIDNMITEFSNFNTYINSKVMPVIEQLTGQKGFGAIATAVTAVVTAIGVLKVAMMLFTAGNPVLAGVLAGIGAIVTAVGYLITAYNGAHDAAKAFLNLTNQGGATGSAFSSQSGTSGTGFTGTSFIPGAPTVSAPTGGTRFTGTTVVPQANRPTTINVNINRAQVNADDVTKALNDKLKNQGSSLRIQ